MKNKISIIGCGYVGLSYSILLGVKNIVTVIDISQKRIKSVNARKNYLDDITIDKYFKNKKLNITATTNYNSIADADFIFICLPTDFDNNNYCLNTKLITKTINNIIKVNKIATIVLKSTVPVGYTKRIIKKFKTNKIIYSPEFLREKTSLSDCLNPKRIVIGGNGIHVNDYKKLILNSIKNKNVKFYCMSSSEAESVKLFSNAYLALRISFFNELDSFCEKNKMSTLNVVSGVCADSRIGNYYNNPSFGYGGYCLPKDIKELSNYFNNTNTCLIKAIDKSNNLRKQNIINYIENLNYNLIGIYKINSTNDFIKNKEVPVVNILENIKINKNKIIIFSSKITETIYNGYRIIKNLDEFKALSDIIIADKLTDEILDVQYKVYSRDISFKL